MKHHTILHEEHHLPHIMVGHVPLPKLKKALKTGKLHLTEHEIGGGTHKLHLHPESHKKALAAKHKHRGVHLHITKHEIEHGLRHGGSLWDSIKSGLSSAGKWLSDNGTKILDSAAAVGKVIAPELTPFIDVGRDVARTVTGKGISMPIMSGSGKKSSHELKEFRIELLKKARAAKKHHSKLAGGSFLPAGY